MRRMGEVGKLARQFGAAQRQRHQVQYRSASTQDTPPLVQPKRRQPATSNANPAAANVQRAPFTSASSGPSGQGGSPSPLNPSGSTNNRQQNMSGVDTDVVEPSTPDTDQQGQQFDVNDIAERVYNLLLKEMREQQYRSGKRHRL